MNKIISLLLALVMLTGVLTMAISCGDETPDPTPDGDQTPGDGSNGDEEKGEEYILTIHDINGNPLANITVQFKYGDEETIAMTSGEDGKVSARIDTTEDVTVNVVNPGEYGIPEARDRKFKSNELTIVMPQMVTVKTVDEDGNPVADVAVQICHSVCLSPIATDGSGEINKGIIPKAPLKVSIISGPEGYVIPDEIDVSMDLPIHAYFAEGEYTVVIVIPRA